jgi:DNA-binding response OmpR family regulator
MSKSTLERDSVLVIDDDPDLRALICVLGELCGLRVLEADDCARGLEILEHEQGRMKMILLDYFLPGTEPKKCAGAIMSKAGPSVRVVLITAAVDAAERAAELKIGQWLSKPFDATTLMTLLRNGSRTAR